MNANYEYQPRSQKEILNAAIAKAVKNGYDFKEGIKKAEDISISSYNHETGRLALTIRGRNNIKVIYDNYKLIFFEIEFAKAFFGKRWEEHLDQLAVSKDVFGYLENNMD